MIESEWLTVVDVARLLAVPEKRVRRWLTTGELDAIRPGGPRGNYRIRRSKALAKGAADRT